MALNEVMLGGLLDGFRMGTDHQKDRTMIRSLELSAPPHPCIPGSGEELEIELIMDHAFLSSGLGDLPGCRTHPCARRVACSYSTGTEAPVLGTLPDLSLCNSVWLFICTLYHTL